MKDIEKYVTEKANFLVKKHLDNMPNLKNDIGYIIGPQAEYAVFEFINADESDDMKMTLFTTGEFEKYNEELFEEASKKLEGFGSSVTINDIIVISLC